MNHRPSLPPIFRTDEYAVAQGQGRRLRRVQLHRQRYGPQQRLIRDGDLFDAHQPNALRMDNADPFGIGALGIGEWDALLKYKSLLLDCPLAGPRQILSELLWRNPDVIKVIHLMATLLLARPCHRALPVNRNLSNQYRSRELGGDCLINSLASRG